MSSFLKKINNGGFTRFFDFVLASDLCYTIHIPTGNAGLGGAPQNKVVLCGKNEKWRKIAMPMALVWFAAIVLAVIIEALTNQLVSIWFVAGGIVALIVSLFDAPLWLQCLLYVLVSAVTLLATRPLSRKLLHLKKEDTNADRYIGKTGTILVEVNNSEGKGQVEVMGSVWSARSENGGVIPAGSSVLVKEITGVKLVVNPIPKN